MKHTYLITGVIIVVVGVAAFFGGMQYQKSQRPQIVSLSGQGRQGQFTRQFGTGQGNRGGGVIGEILSQDDKSITLKLADGSSKIVIISSATAINKQATGSKSDLKTGERVAVFGSTNADGSVTAQNIQLNPQVRIRPTGETPPAK